jgi:peroxiredoxin Q/BCP
MSTLQVGDKAPSFTTTAVGGDYGSGTPLNLSELKGSPVVLYFYPKDDTPGCTTQACGIRDSWNELKKTGAAIFGVSIDPDKSHAKFITKFDLPFPLLSDTDKSIVEAYGVWVEKSMYGKTYMGIERSTFLIDKSGKIAKAWRKVKVDGHAAEVMAAAASL